MVTLKNQNMDNSEQRSTRKTQKKENNNRKQSEIHKYLLKKGI